MTDRSLAPAVPRPRGLVLFAPFWAGVISALALAIANVLPFVSMLLFPLAAAQLARSCFLLPMAASRILVTALTPAAAFALAIVVAPGQSWLAAVVATALVALPALALAAGAGEGRRKDALLLLVAAVTAIGVLSILLGLGLSVGDPGARLAARVGRLLPEVLSYYEKAGVSEGLVSTVRRAFELNRLLLSQFLPGLALCFSVVYAALLVYPFGGVAGLAGRDLTEVPFSRFSTPVVAAALFVPAGALAALGSPQVRRPAVDLLLPLLALFFLRGLAIIRALLDRARAGVLGQLLVFALVLLTPFPVIVALGGLFDEFLDLRARLERKEPDPD